MSQNQKYILIAVFVILFSAGLYFFLRPKKAATGAPGNGTPGTGGNTGTGSNGTSNAGGGYTPTNAPLDPNTVYRQGASGPTVKEIQKNINWMIQAVPFWPGSYPNPPALLTVDGNWGPATTAAVRYFWSKDFLSLSEAQRFGTPARDLLRSRGYNV